MVKMITSQIQTFHLLCNERNLCIPFDFDKEKLTAQLNAQSQQL